MREQSSKTRAATSPNLVGSFRVPSLYLWEADVPTGNFVLERGQERVVERADELSLLSRRSYALLQSRVRDLG